MFQKFKDRRRQRRYTQWHREVEQDGFRLMSLDDHMPPTYNGRRSWCDAVLQECPVPGHDLCCFCTHSEQTPAEVLTDREDHR